MNSTEDVIEKETLIKFMGTRNELRDLKISNHKDRPCSLEASFNVVDLSLRKLTIALHGGEGDECEST